MHVDLIAFGLYKGDFVYFAGNEEPDLKLDSLIEVAKEK